MGNIRRQLFKLNYCKCGCKKLCNKKFIHGHNRKGIKYQSKLKDKGKPRVNSSGYILIKKSKYIRLHRLIYEEHYKCCLLKSTVIHHIDGNRKNNEISNIKPMFKKEHDKLTAKSRPLKDMNNRVCLLCYSKNTYNRRWFRYKEEFICKKCKNKTSWIEKSQGGF